MIMRLRQLAVLTVVGAIASGGIGAAFAIAQMGDQKQPFDHQGVGQTQRTQQLSDGTTPNNKPYSVFETRPQWATEYPDATCIEIAVDAVGAETCLPSPRGEDVFHAAYAILDETLFVFVLADADVNTIQVTRLDGVDSTGVFKEVDLNQSVRLLYRVIEAPHSTLPELEPGHPIPPDLRVQALDAASAVIKSEVLRVPPPDEVQEDRHRSHQAR